MKTSLQRIITKDNIELVGLLHEPENQTNKILIHVHGMAGNFYENHFLDFIAKTLTANGIAFFAFNNRGCELVKDLLKGDDLIRIGNAYEKFEESTLDIESAIDFAYTKGFSEIHLSGHSLGAPKVAYYTAEQKDTRVTSVIFLSPSDMIGLAKIDKNYEKDMGVAQNMVEEGKGWELIPFPVLWDKSFLSAQTYVSFGSEDSKVAIFNFHNPEDKLSVLEKITIPTLAVMGKKDDALVIPIEDTMQRIKDAMTNSKKVETTILGEANHSYDDYEQKLADVLKEWINV